MECYTCHNSYPHCFQVVVDGKEYEFDCFECAIHALAPTCAECGCRVIGHGVELNHNVYCSMHCAREEITQPVPG